MTIIKTRIPNVFIIFQILILASCAHHRDVRPGGDGIHRVVIRAETKEQGEQEALSQANNYCESKNKEAAIVDEKSVYSGDMKEEDYKITKTAGKAAQMIGGTAYAFGGQKESNAGGIVGLGGAVASGIAGNGYTTEMRFKCN